MDNEVLDEIKKIAVEKLKQKYGYCSLAENDEFAQIDSSDGKGNDIRIKITIKKED